MRLAIQPLYADTMSRAELGDGIAVTRPYFVLIVVS